MTDEKIGQGLLCPSCNIELRMSERQGIEIDYCPNCRGVWLDRGELDKIIERSMSEADPAATSTVGVFGDRHGGHGRGVESHGGHGSRGGHDQGRHGSDRHHGRSSFLRRLFD